ncbi:MAG: hypothetical protein A3F67_07130 [Verrucomicrobia bacterium RIFCSPHIGHO2_12_FULL_41_10]|nr:MAG: hypothetical protein A3F67_07130 [Verrucomicrobia bacterium RIFCSPHIGHO2_12_FULL_41_10]HLB34354.1 hypothetical protein [Chthoniobacterales bacterium]
MNNPITSRPFSISGLSSRSFTRLPKKPTQGEFADHTVTTPPTDLQNHSNFLNGFNHTSPPVILFKSKKTSLEHLSHAEIILHFQNILNDTKQVETHLENLLGALGNTKQTDHFKKLTKEDHQKIEAHEISVRTEWTNIITIRTACETLLNSPPHTEEEITKSSHQIESFHQKLAIATTTCNALVTLLVGYGFPFHAYQQQQQIQQQQEQQEEIVAEEQASNVTLSQQRIAREEIVLDEKEALEKTIHNLRPTNKPSLDSITGTQHLKKEETIHKQELQTVIFGQQAEDKFKLRV